jgi:hypothetical protein
LGDADSRLRARVLARLARALVSTPQVDRRLQVSQEAVALARRLDDPVTLAAVLYDRHLAIWGVEPAALAGERLAMATEVVDLAERTGDWAMALRGRGLRRTDLLELGDVAGFDADLAAAERTAEQLRQLHHRWQLPLAHATRAMLAGRFAEPRSWPPKVWPSVGGPATRAWGSGMRRLLRPFGGWMAASVRASSCSGGDGEPGSSGDGRTCGADQV